MRDIEKEFPNIINTNAMRLQDITLQSLTDDKVLDSGKFFEYAEFSLNYILNNLSEYGDQLGFKKPEYIHHADRSYLSLIFKGKSNMEYHSILERTGRRECVELVNYFMKRDLEGSVLEIHRIKDDQIVKTEEGMDPRGTQLYNEVIDIIEDIDNLKSSTN